MSRRLPRLHAGFEIVDAQTEIASLGVGNERRDVDEDAFAAETADGDLVSAPTRYCVWGRRKREEDIKGVGRNRWR